MAFTLPTFNLPCGIYTNYAVRVFRLPVMVNLSPGRRIHVGQGLYSNYLLLPKLTDIRDGYSTTGNDAVEVPAGSGRWYFVEDVDDVAKGFANEYRWAAISKLVGLGLPPAWPTPYP